MKQAGEQSKRLVSKSEYAKVQATRIFWWMDSLLAYTVAFSCLLIILVFAFGILRFAPWAVIRDLDVTEYVWLLLLFPLLMHVCAASGKWCLTRSRTVEPVSPFTSHIIARLPAPASLVRASQEPVETQKSVLLRAASEPQEKHTEQLMRAAARGENQPDRSALVNGVL